MEVVQVLIPLVLGAFLFTFAGFFAMKGVYTPFPADRVGLVTLTIVVGLFGFLAWTSGYNSLVGVVAYTRQEEFRYAALFFGYFAPLGFFSIPFLNKLL